MSMTETTASADPKPKNPTGPRKSPQERCVEEARAWREQAAGKVAKLQTQLAMARAELFRAEATCRELERPAASVLAPPALAALVNGEAIKTPRVSGVWPPLTLALAEATLVEPLADEPGRHGHSTLPADPPVDSNSLESLGIPDPLAAKLRTLGLGNVDAILQAIAGKALESLMDLGTAEQRLGPKEISTLRTALMTRPATEAASPRVHAPSSYVPGDGPVDASTSAAAPPAAVTLPPASDPTPRGADGKPKRFAKHKG